MKLIFILLVGWGMGMTANAQESKALEWDFFHPLRKEWMPLGTFGSVQEALIASGEMPDPFYGTNEQKFGWFEDHVWEFKSIFTLTAEDLKSEYLELEFGSIDTYGAVSLNGKSVMKTANAFIPHRAQIKSLLKVGVNELTVSITPPVLYHAEMWKTAEYHLPAPNDLNPIAIAPYTRKPQYQFGWDWALRMNTIGFNKPAFLHVYNDNRLINKSMRVLSLTESEAVVEFTLFLANDKNETYTWESDRFGSIELPLKNGQIKRVETIQNPRLWWPRGQGESYLYDEHVSLLNNNNETLAHFDFDFGVKTSELIQEQDAWGTSYYFKINGRKIFCKGGDYIPQDIFPARVKGEAIVNVVQDMAVANFNMVRVWGGGYYPDEIFFETCDRLGIMVWEDLMFACSMYPGDDQFVANITEEFEYQVPRIAGHASVVQFNGNNEVEVAWGNWGFQIKYGLYGKSAKEIEDSYDRVFKNVAPSIVSKYTDLPYIHTSPLSNWGKTELYNHGSQHYWGVWHGKDPIQDFGKKTGRFNAEYGFQSFPEYSTLLTFSDTSQWELNSEVMKAHQKSYVGNDMILKHAKRLYGTPSDFGQFVYFSQLTQATAVSMAIAGHRIDYPRCGGTLYWQVNDCWQAPTWSSIDYFGNWKALHYWVQKDYEDIAVVAQYDDLEHINYYIVSGVVDTFECNILCHIKDAKGKLIRTLDLALQLNGQESRKLELNPALNSVLDKNVRLEFEWNNAHGKPFTRAFDRMNSDFKVAECKDVEFTILTSDISSGTVTIEIDTKKYLRDFWLYCDVTGVRFDRNFESLPIGKHLFEVSNVPEGITPKFEMRWR